MGILDRWLRRGAGETAFTVPPGFKIDLWTGVLDVPSVTAMDGGVRLASTGPATDTAGDLFAALFELVAELLARPSPRAQLPSAALSMAELCRAAPPPVEAVDGVVVWTLQRGSLQEVADDPDALRELLERFDHLGVGRQVVVAHPKDVAETPWVFQLLQGLDIDVRKLRDDGRVLAEVHRPDGTILSAVLGSPPLLRRLDDARGHIARGLERLTDRTTPREPEPLGVAPRLRRLIASVAHGEPGAREPLYRYLRDRRTPLLMIVGAGAGGRTSASLHGDDDGGLYVDALPDLHTIQTLTSGGSPPMVVKPPAEMLAFADQLGYGLALKIVEDGDRVVRALLPRADARELAAGRLPSDAAS